MSKRLRWRWGVVALTVMAALSCASGLWGDGEAIGPDDWQYRELDALGRAGLLMGHPKGPIGDWTHDLTRYEAASLTLRAVEGLGEAYRQQGEALSELAGPEPREQPMQPQAVTIEDLARVEKLIQEFRTELVTMGARVDDLQSALDAVDRRLTELETTARKHQIHGYVQARYDNDQAPGQNPTFAVRRARFNFRGPLTEKIGYRLEFQADAALPGEGAGTTTALRTAWADYTTGAARSIFGQAKIPWGYELLESSADLWTSERAFFMDRLFPDQRDIGLQVRVGRTPGSPQFDAGVFNGTGINTDDDNKRKSVMARINWPVNWPARDAEVALSGYMGTDGEGARATDQDRYGIGARFRWLDGTQFAGEYAFGRDLGASVRGWYAQLGRPISRKRPNLLFIKYDWYDENTDAVDDLFKRWSLGYWWDPKPPLRMRFAYEIRHPQAGFSEFLQWRNDRYWLELQLVY